MDQDQDKRMFYCRSRPRGENVLLWIKTKIRECFTMDQDQDKRMFYYGSRQR